jgi:hypothetical protein
MRQQQSIHAHDECALFPEDDQKGNSKTAGSVAPLRLPLIVANAA